MEYLSYEDRLRELELELELFSLERKLQGGPRAAFQNLEKQKS